MKTYRSIQNTDLASVDTATLERARDELTDDLAQDRIHSIEKQTLFALAARLVGELEKRKGGREQYQQERKRMTEHKSSQPDGSTTLTKKGRGSSLFGTFFLFLIVTVLIAMAVYFYLQYPL